MDGAKQITYEPTGQFLGPGIGEYMSVEGKRVAFLKKAVHGPGYFLQIFGVKWQNAPGARYPQELDARTDFTYCKTRRKAEERLIEEMKRSKANAQTD